MRSRPETGAERGRRPGWRSAAALGAAVALGACGGGPSPQPDATPGTLPSRPSPADPSNATQAFATDAVLSIGLGGEPANWNPLAAPDRADPALAVVADAVLPSVFETGPGLDSTRNDELATSATETSQQPQTIVYSLNSRAVWSDGVPITGADFVYTWQAQSGRSRFRDARGGAFTPASTTGYRQISSVTSGAGDPDRVVVRFATPDPDWEGLFDPLLPAHAARAVGFDRGFTDPVTSLISGGPFLVQSYQPGADVMLVRNPRWWGPAANLAAIDVTFVDAAAVATAGLQQGQLDAAVTAFTPATVAALSATAGLTVSVGNGDSFDDLVFNERAGPLTLRAVRLALMLAVDRQGLAHAVAASGDTAAAPVRNRAFPPGSAGYRDETAVLGATGVDLTRARQLLAAAGYATRNATLTRHGRAVRLTLATDTSSPLAADEVTAIVVAARALGIAVAPSGSASAHRRGVGADSMVLVEAPMTASPAVLGATYGSGAVSRSGYSSAVMDGLLARLAATRPTVERAEIIDQVDAQAWSDAVDLPLLGVPQVLAFQTRYVNLTPAPSVAGVADDMARWGITRST